MTRAVKRPYLGETYYFEVDAHPWNYLYCDNVCIGGHPDRTDQN